METNSQKELTKKLFEATDKKACKSNLKDSTILWRRLYQARMLALHNVTDTMDLRYVLSQPHLDVPWIQLHSLTNCQLYDWFIRPLERLVAIDMTLTNRLQWAFTCKDGTEDLVKILLQLAGLPDTPKQHVCW